MADLIDRDELMENLKRINAVDYGSMMDWRTHGCVEEALSDVLCIAKEAKSVDAEPVRHGRWENHPDVGGYLRCGKCKDVVIAEDWLVSDKWKYCPRCGKKKRIPKGRILPDGWTRFVFINDIIWCSQCTADMEEANKKLLLIFGDKLEISDDEY